MKKPVLGALALLALLPGTAASAAPRPTPTPPSVSLDRPGSAPAKGDRLTVGVQPAKATAPDARAHFDYRLTAGAVVTDYVAVFNYSAKPVSLKLYARDALTTTSGDLDVQHYDTKPTDVGAWLALAAPEVALKPRTRVIVPFQLGLPFNATPGDHTGAIVAALTTTSTKDGRTVQVENRVGLRVYLRVAGAVTRRLDVTNLRARFRGGLSPLARGPADVSFVVRNTGNVRIGGSARVKVHDVFGRTVATVTLDEDSVLLPGSAVPVSVRLPSVLGTVRMSATVSVESVQRTTPFWAVPWIPVLVVVTLLGGLGYRRNRRKTNPPQSGKHRRDPAEPKHSAKVQVPVAMVAGLTLVVLVGLLAAAMPSFAASGPGPWAATVQPAHGADDTPIQVLTSGGCPSPATSILARVYGAGFPAEGVNVVGNTSAGVRRDSAFTVPLVVTLRDVARDQQQLVTLRGTYRIDVICRTARDPKPLGTYSAALAFSSPTAWTAAKPVTTAKGPVEAAPSPGATAPGGTAPGATGGAAATPGAPGATAPNGAIPGVPNSAPTTAARTSRGRTVPVVPIGLGGLAVVAAFLAGRRRGAVRTA